MEWQVRRLGGEPGVVVSLAASDLFRSVPDCLAALRPPSAFPSAQCLAWACSPGERYAALPWVPPWQRQGVVWWLVHFSVVVQAQEVPCSWRPDVLSRVGGASVSGGLPRPVSCSPLPV